MDVPRSPDSTAELLCVCGTELDIRPRWGADAPNHAGSWEWLHRDGTTPADHTPRPARPADIDLRPGVWVRWQERATCTTRQGVVEQSATGHVILADPGEPCWLVRCTDGADYVLAASRLAPAPQLARQRHPELCLCPNCRPAGATALPDHDQEETDA